MSAGVFGVLLFAAAFHAAWNAIVKASGNKLFSMISIAATATVIAAFFLPFLASPSIQSWPFIIASVSCQLIYSVLVAKTYAIADMGQAYPLMRGSAPLLVALVSIFWPGEYLSITAWAGIAVICTAILCMALSGTRRGDMSGVILALVNAGFIAAYTLIDGAGVRVSGSPTAYTMWVFFLNGFFLASWAFARHGRKFARHVAMNWKFGLIGGIGTLISYGLALWAMTVAPVAMVAALRETSILFGALISGLILHEKMGAMRIASAFGIALGAVILRLG